MQSKDEHTQEFDFKRKTQDNLRSALTVDELLKLIPCPSHNMAKNSKNQKLDIEKIEAEALWARRLIEEKKFLKGFQRFRECRIIN